MAVARNAVMMYEGEDEIARPIQTKRLQTLHYYYVHYDESIKMLLLLITLRCRMNQHGQAVEHLDKVLQITRSWVIIVRAASRRRRILT